ncbi:MAG TPA: hypothetical protein DEB06_02385 [Phycisphaerales bacterium]|nr:hypothetical protein [Phycisphaerales bacterium]
MSFGLFKSSAPPIAVDFGVSALKMLQLLPGDPPSLLAAAMLATPDELIDKPAERLSFQTEALPNLLRKGGFRGKRAVCSVSCTQAFVQHMQVQPTPGARTEFLVSEQVRLITGRDPSGFVLRHIDVCEVSRGGVKKQEVIVIALPRETVIEHMKALKSVRLEPVGVHTEHMALSRSIGHLQRRAEDKQSTIMLVDLGYGSTKVVVVREGEPVLAKSVLIAGRQLDGAVAKAGKCALSDARRRRAVDGVSRVSPLQSAPRAILSASSAVPAAKSTSGGSGGGSGGGTGATTLAEDRRVNATPPGFTALTPGVAPQDDPALAEQTLAETIADEIAMCHRYHQALFPDHAVDRVIFTGGGAERPDLCQAVTNALRLPTLAADPLSGLPRPGDFKALGLDLSRPTPGWAMPLGLAVSPTDL